MPDTDELLTKELWYRDAHGFLQKLRVTKATARAVETVWRSYRRAEERWARRHVPFTDLDVLAKSGDEGPGIDQADEKMAERLAERRKRDNDGYGWVGPRLPIRRVIGSSQIWAGPPALYEFCGGRPLEPGEACLDCDRIGNELLLPGLTTEERKGLRRPPRQDGLKGGTEGSSGQARARAASMK